jgi:glycosyltransferase involved in cell wall biosynthesis
MNKFVSIVTVTKDRPLFIQHLKHNISCLEYDKSSIEWVVVDDGKEPIFNHVKNFQNLVYTYKRNHTPLGEKRNFANSLTTGEFILYFDDDNYAFPSRIRESISLLEDHPEYDIVGSSEMFILNTRVGKVYVTGPFSNNHATLGTWAFRRSLLNQTQFLKNAKSGEEVSFTKKWTLRIGQLDKFSTSVCVDHGNNTVSKQHILADAKTFFSISEIIKDNLSRDHFRKLVQQSQLC